METDHLMGSVPILSVKWTVSIGTMLNLDGDGNGHGDGDGTCKQVFTDTNTASPCMDFTSAQYKFLQLAC